MPRWRPPQARGSAYITAEGHERLREELDHLWRVRRPEVTAALAAAAAEGDRSENAEYIYRKKELGGIDRRVRYLRKRLAELKVVDSVPDDKERVFFGAWVRIIHPEGREQELRIVGPDETDAKLGYISIDSPIARALHKRNAGESVEVELPGGMTRLEIDAVQYRPFATG